MKAIITLQQLIDAKACPTQCYQFQKLFGDSVEVTVERAEKCTHIFNWDWAAETLLNQTNSKEYFDRMIKIYLFYWGSKYRRKRIRGKAMTFAAMYIYQCENSKES